MAVLLSLTPDCRRRTASFRTQGSTARVGGAGAAAATSTGGSTAATESIIVRDITAGGNTIAGRDFTTDRGAIAGSDTIAGSERTAVGAISVNPGIQGTDTRGLTAAEVAFGQ